MAGLYPSRGEFTIPTDFFKEHEWISDSLLDGTVSQLCRLVYPPEAVECSNCYLDPVTGRSSHKYKVGGPLSFDQHTICPLCNGEGRQNTEKYDDVRLRVYTTPKDFQDIGIPIASPDGIVQVIGYMTDLPKIQQANKIITHIELQDMLRLVCEKHSIAVPWGFLGNRYFIMYLKRVPA